MSLRFVLYNIFHNERLLLKSFLIWLSSVNEKIPKYTCWRERKSAAVLKSPLGATYAQFGTLLELRCECLT
jgi:hypothetical protein